MGLGIDVGVDGRGWLLLGVKWDRKELKLIAYECIAYEWSCNPNPNQHVDDNHVRKHHLPVGVGLILLRLGFLVGTLVVIELSTIEVGARPAVTTIIALI